MKYLQLNPKHMEGMGKNIFTEKMCEEKIYHPLNSDEIGRKLTTLS